MHEQSEEIAGKYQQSLHFTHKGAKFAEEKRMRDSQFAKEQTSYSSEQLRPNCSYEVKMRNLQSCSIRGGCNFH